MGMDVSGRNPTNESGEYFRASIWSWRPIHAIMSTIGKDLLDEKLITQMCYNDGAGPEDGEICWEIGDRIEKSLATAENDDDFRLAPESTPGFYVYKEDGRFVPSDAEYDPETMESPYAVSQDHLREFATFLKHCGGFEVW